MLDSTQRTTAAELLWAAERDLAPIDPLTETFPGIDVVDAYEIQLINIRRKIAAGARVRGHKVGLSSPVMQQMMGVDEPDYGHLLDSMVLGRGRADPGRPATATRGSRSRSATCSGPPCPARTAPRPTCCAATEYIVPSLELIDSRIRRLADQAGRHHRRQRLLGGRHPRRGPPDARRAGGRPASTWRTSTPCCTRGDEEVARGNTSAVLGNPTACVAWLARKVADFGVKLEAGHLILPGSCTRAIDARPGTAFRAEFAGLGTVTAFLRVRAEGMTP